MRITAVVRKKRSLVELVLESEAAVQVDEQTFIMSGLKIDDDIDEEQLMDLLQKSNDNRAREKALWLLEHKNYTNRELTRKISEKLPKESAQKAADKMEDLGLVDDRKYAEMYSKDMQNRRHFGIMRIRQELYRKGISKEIIDEIIEEIPEENNLQNIREVVEKKYQNYATDEKVRRRAFAALTRMGYGYDDINTVLKDQDNE
jgi:regulatory protein